MHVRVNDDAGQTWSRDVDVTAAEDGTISDQFKLPDWFVAQYSVTATGASSGTATWTFTDGNVTLHLASTEGVADMTVTFDRWNGSSTCTGTATLTNQTVTATSGGTVNIPGFGGSGDSVKLKSVTTSTAGKAFDKWTSAVGTTGSAKNTDSGVDVPGSPTPCISNGSGGTNGNLQDAFAHFRNSNTAPVADSQSVSTNEDTAKAITLTGSDADGNSLTFAVGTGPSHGTLGSIGAVTCTGTAPKNCSASLTYTPAANYNGSDSFTFKVNDGNLDSAAATVSITVNAVNDAPTADSQSISTNEDTAKAITLTGSDVDGNSLSFAIVAGPSHGTLGSIGSVSCTGTAPKSCSAGVTYTPAANYNGSDSFTFKANDGTADSSAATVSITVNAVNDAPTCSNGSATTDEDTPKAITLNCSDVDGDSLTYSIVSGPAHGSVSSGTSASRTYSPAANYNGSDSFTFKASDGSAESNTATFNITVNAVNDAPAADSQSVSTNEDTAKAITLTGSDIDGDSLTFAKVAAPTHGSLGAIGPVTCTGTAPKSCSAGVTYTPAANYNGSDSFTFKVNDGTLDSAAATVSITVNAVNDDPTIARDNASVTVDEGQTAHNTGTFGDVDGDTVTFNASVGTVTKNDSDGTWSWSYATDDGPSDSQTVTVNASDGHGGSSSTTFSLVVTNVAPSATFSAPASVNEGSDVHISLASASDPAGADTSAGFTYAFDCGSGYGTFGAANNKDCPTNDNGSRTVKGKIKDKDGGVSEYTASVTIANVAPTATFNASDVNEGSDIHLSLTGASDPSSADTAAGFTYAFNCGSGYGAFGSSSSADCPTNDNGSRTVKGKVKDKDGGVSEYTASVTIANVAPTVTLVGAASADEGDTKSYTYSWTDPGSADTFPAAGNSVSCGTHGTSSDEVFDPSSKSGSFKCHWTDDSGAGTADVKATVTDDDGGVGSDTIHVAVANVAPSATFTAPSSVNEGSDIHVSLTDVVDPGTGDTHQYRFKCGASDWTDYGNDSTHACPTADNGTVTVKGQVRDDDGGESAIYSADVTVNNVAPTVALVGAASADEGDTKSYTYSWTDPGTADTFPAGGNSVTCGTHGTSSDEVFDPSSRTGSFKCHWTDDSGAGTADVSASVTDDDDGVGSDTIHVSVANVAPKVNLTGPDSVNEGDQETYHYTTTDPGEDDVVSFVSGYPTCGDYGELVGTPAIGDGTFDCKFPDGPRTTDVKVKVQDDDGGVSVADTEHVEIISVAIANVAPTAILGNNGPVEEGSPAAVSFSDQLDPSADDTSAGFRYDYHCDGSAFGTAPDYSAASTSDSHDCTFPDGPSDHAVRARIIDRNNDATVYTTLVHVDNAPPDVTAAAGQSSDEGESHGFSLGSFADPGADTWTADVDWGDGTPHDSPVVGSPGTIPATNHTYDDNGTFTVTVTVTDKDGGSDSATFTVTVADVAPTATFNAPASVDEGSSFTISLTAPHDLSSADTTAGFQYKFDCGNGTFGAYGAGSSASCPSSDDGTLTVRGRIKDKDGGYTNYTASVQVNNVPPVVTGPANQSSDEGENHTFTLGSFTDPGADTWTVDVDWGDGTPHSHPAVGSAGVIPATQHKYGDNGAFTATVKVTDDDGGYDSKNFSVTVANVPPSGSLGNNGPVNEGSSVTVSFSGVSDPSTADAASLRYAFDCNGGSLAGTTYATASPTNSKSCSFDDGPSTPTVTGVIIDKDGGRRADATTVQVKNVAPTATFSNDGPVNEGSSFHLTFSSPSDPSTADTTAGFQYAFDCGDGSGYGAFGSSNSATCPTSDNGTRSVKGRVRDKDGGVTEYTASVTVRNVDPAATFNAPASVNEGSSIGLSLTGPSDPSSADATAGFQYAFDCGTGSGFGADGSSSTASCPTTDNGSRTVRGRIKDKDGGSTIYSASVTVSNVAPHITSVTATNTFAGPLVFMTSAIDTLFTDPGSADTWANLLTFSDGGSQSSSTVTPQGGGSYRVTQARSFTTAGCKTVTSRVTDDDGGFDVFGPTPLNVGTGEFQPPMTNTPVTNKLKNGQVLPVKIRLTDCNGTPVTGLNPAIRLKAGDQTQTNDDSIVAITPGSVSAADTTGVMRSNGDGSYIYNMSVNIPLNTDYTVIVYPFGIGTTSQYLAHVIQATK
ncbi:MAG TPA: Ig-like domain-containing protein [Gaiellaceae bacterium]|nr:Ig-like domain-containing protein [Gaiellaceae bacterium]